MLHILTSMNLPKHLLGDVEENELASLGETLKAGDVVIHHLKKEGRK